MVSRDRTDSPFVSWEIHVFFLLTAFLGVSDSDYIEVLIFLYLSIIYDHAERTILHGRESKFHIHLDVKYEEMCVHGLMHLNTCVCVWTFKWFHVLETTKTHSALNPST